MAKRCRVLLLSICASTCAAQYLVVGGNVGNVVPTNTAGPGFPGANAAATNASWSLGHQPTRLESWPQIGFGTGERVLLPCWKKIVLHDHVNGWPGLCKNLKRAENYTTLESCRSLCWNDPRCTVWQFVNQTVPSQCWVGFGTHCAYREGETEVNGKDIVVQEAQRLMHGDVRVLKNLSGWKISNLYQLGMYQSTSEPLQIQRCKAWCYSMIACEYWQYGPGGCWVDAPMFTTDHGSNPGNQVQYPLTTDGGASQSTTDAKTMNQGEYIQHYCPPQVVDTPAPALQIAPPITTPAPRDASLMSQWWMWVLLGAGILGGGGAAIYLLFLKQPGDGKAARSTRGVPIKSEYSDDLMTESSEARNLVSPSPPRRNPDADFMQEPSQNAYEGDYGPPNRYDDSRGMPDTPQDSRGGRGGGGGSSSQQWVPKNLLNAAPGPLPRDTAQQGPPMQHQVTHGGGMVSSLPAPTQLVDDTRAAAVLRRPTLMQQGGMPYQQQQQQQQQQYQQQQYPQQQMYPGMQPQRLM